MSNRFYNPFSSVELSKDFLASYRSKLPRWSQNIIGVDRKALQVAEAANLSEQKLLSLGVPDSDYSGLTCRVLTTHHCVGALIVGC